MSLTPRPPLQVFTSNESPPEKRIPFHHEMAQTPNPPAVVIFYCDVPAATGGATPIVLSSEVAAYVDRVHPRLAVALRRGVQYHRKYPEVTDTASAIGMSWKTTFNVSTQIEAEEILARSKGYSSWQFTPEGDLLTTSINYQAIMVDPRTGTEVFFNQV